MAKCGLRSRLYWGKMHTWRWGFPYSQELSNVRFTRASWAYSKYRCSKEELGLISALWGMILKIQKTKCSPFADPSAVNFSSKTLTLTILCVIIQFTMSLGKWQVEASKWLIFCLTSSHLRSFLSFPCKLVVADVWWIQ